MSTPEIAGYIDGLAQPWQAEISHTLDAMIRRAVPGVTARLQYGKPHYLQGKSYAAVIGPAKGWVALTIFNAASLDAPDGLFEPGPPERRTIKIKPGQEVDYAQLETLLAQAAASAS